MARHGRLEWCPGEGLPAIWVPPQTVVEQGRPQFSLQGVVAEGPDLAGWQEPLVTSMLLQGATGYPRQVWFFEDTALAVWRTIVPGDEVRVEGRAIVVFRRPPPKPIRHKDILLVCHELTLVTSGSDDAQRDAVLLARQLDRFRPDGPSKRRRPRSRRS